MYHGEGSEAGTRGVRELDRTYVCECVRCKSFLQDDLDGIDS